ncbi:MAG TPA: GDSL-type esterase/lipase family protein [Clostridia bacterium]
MTKPDINDSIERTDEHHIERHNYFMNYKMLNKIDLLFLGDSIIRRWAEVPHLWNSYFSEFNPANFGVGSDTIQNLKWRLLNGELEGISPKVVVLLIGTNNLPQYSENEIMEGITGLVNIVKQKLPCSKIILMGMFPRDADDQCSNYASIIAEINKKLFCFAQSSNLVFLDIGKEFIDENNLVNRTIIPDGLHPIEPGYKIWGDKLYPVIKDIF